MQLMTESFDKQLQNKDSNLTALKDTLSAPKSRLDALERISRRKRADVWAVPQKPAEVQKFLEHFLLFMSFYYQGEGRVKSTVIYLCHKGARCVVDVSIEGIWTH